MGEQSTQVNPSRVKKAPSQPKTDSPNKPLPSYRFRTNHFHIYLCNQVLSASKHTLQTNLEFDVTGNNLWLLSLVILPAGAHGHSTHRKGLILVNDVSCR
jgi:hypothetical protein